jgi:molybdopterin-guanine dinucleotide biosynthesis protein B
LCIVGARRHVGKTTLLIKIVGEMKKRGLAIGTVKHVGDRSSFDFYSSKDTGKHLEAGSNVTLAVTASEIITIRRDLPITLESAISLMPSQLDYILVEGFRHSVYPKIIVVSSYDEDVQDVSGDTIALVLDGKEIKTDNRKDQGEKFSEARLVDLIEGYFRGLH